MSYSQADQIKTILDGAQRVVVIQADNPDADSLGSALALEHILGDLGKDVALYCAVDVPSYLRYLEGWDRVLTELPKQFDASIFVDVSTLTLLEKLRDSGELGWVAARASIVLDHHGSVDNQIDFATTMLVDPHASSCGEVVYHLAKQLGWRVNPSAGAHIMTGILADTQGLANDLASAATYRVMAELVELGVNRPDLEERRREYNRMPQEIYHYKGALLTRTSFEADGRIASIDIPQAEITAYSPLYNPAPLVQNDMLSTAGVGLAIVFKHYDDGKVTAAIRANVGFGVADKLAEKMGGGGHPFASGFKDVTGRPFNEIKSECTSFATELLNNLAKDATDETVQHTDAPR